MGDIGGECVTVCMSNAGLFCSHRKAVLWIRTGFNADPDPAFYLNADQDPDPDPGSPTNAVPGQTSNKV